jgi:DNA repair photolyase
MFPSSHDITPSSLEACMTVLDNLLKAGNRVLIVSKPHLECIKAICEKFASFKDLILFRFTIGARDDGILSFWEPNAPAYAERRASLQHAFSEGFATSVSIEPMLDSGGIDGPISDLSPYVTHSIWIGTMNHLGRLEKHADAVLKQAINRIRQGQTDARIMEIYQRHKDNPKIRWKKEIRKIVGI